MTISPATIGHGIVFRRLDLPGRDHVAASFDLVERSPLCTKIVSPTGGSVRTIEHLMAALAAFGIDNAAIDIDGEELPILDGSSLPYIKLLEAAGRRSQGEPLRVAEVLRPVEVSMGPAWVRIEPNSALSIAASIDFPDEAIGRQSIHYDGSYASFRSGFAQCRTFCRASDVEAMRQAGCAKGGTYENAVVFDGSKILTPGGLRANDEPVRHKVLDMVGDLALFPFPLRGKITAHRPGHALTNLLLREISLRRSSWSVAAERPIKVAAA
jgi:UDP-3-O-[3-hydroxymyristoyl] N-acetylglucosamine deacetylase